MIPGLGRSPGEGKDYPLQYSGLENSMDCIVHGEFHGLYSSWGKESDMTDFHFHIKKKKTDLQKALVIVTLGLPR